MENTLEDINFKMRCIRRELKSIGVELNLSTFVKEGTEFPLSRNTNEKGENWFYKNREGKDIYLTTFSR